MRAPAADTLERLVPEALAPGDTAGLASLDLHVERYRFAAGHLRPGRVLDIACGVGYGSAILAERGDVEVLGVDLSEHAVAWARQQHARPRLEFRVGDALAFEDAAGFDTIVSLETLEHVADPGRLIERFAALLRPGGTLIGSVPTTLSTDLNPHHLHDFSDHSFRRLVADRAPDLREIASLAQVQPVAPFAVLQRRELRMRDRRSSLPTYYLRHPGALGRRIASTLRFGLNNHYRTIVWRSPPAPDAGAGARAGAAS